MVANPRPLDSSAPADREQGPAVDLGIVESLRQLECPTSRLPCTFVVGDPHQKERLACVGQRELASRRQLLEQVDGVPRRPPSFLASPWAPHDAREPGERLTLPEAIAELPVALCSTAKSVDRLVSLVGQVALVRAELVELRDIGKREVFGVPKSSRVLLGRFHDARRPSTHARRQRERT